MTPEMNNFTNGEKEKKMSKITYWKCACETDSDLYSERFKTKRHAMRWWDMAQTSDDPYFRDNYSAPVKMVLEYTGGVFGLLELLRSEEGCGF